jgi:hypothetical protein
VRFWHRIHSLTSANPLDHSVVNGSAFNDTFDTPSPVIQGFIVACFDREWNHLPRTVEQGRSVLRAVLHSGRFLGLSCFSYLWRTAWSTKEHRGGGSCNAPWCFATSHRLHSSTHDNCKNRVRSGYGYHQLDCSCIPSGILTQSY